MNKAVVEEERTVIRMIVKNDDSFLSLFSASETPVISTEVADFIENSTVSIPPAAPLALHIYSNCIDEAEKREYGRAIYAYYAERYRANERERGRNRRIVLLLALVGILFLSIALFLDYSNCFLWAEVMDVAAWVFLWEAVDIGAFRNRDLRLNRMRYRSYMTMSMTYYPLEEQKKA